MKVVCLPGDGIGPEVTAAATRLLQALRLELDERIFGAAANGRAPASGDARRLPGAPTLSCSGAVPTS